MPSFAYKARNSSGDLVAGVVESADSNAAASLLFGRGVTPIEISAAPARAAAVAGGPPKRAFFDPKVTPLDLMLFSRQMYTLLKAGVPIMRALAGLEESAANKTFAVVVRDLRHGLESGRELSASLERHPKIFSSFYTNMVRIGEMTGRLDEIFIRLFEHVEFEKMMRDQVKSAIRYPMFVISTMAVAIIVINMVVIPAFSKVYKAAHAKLPYMTQLLIDFSNFTRDYWPLLLVLAVGGFFAFRFWSGRPPGRALWDRVKLRIPIAGKIILKATLARFARSLALATRSGVPIVQSLTTVAQTVDNEYIAGKIDEMRVGVERGESLVRTATDSRVFTPVVLQMIAVGEETGQVQELMQEIGDMYQSEVEYELKTLSSQIEPILVICLGVLVLILALGVFMPIWDLGKTLVR